MVVHSNADPEAVAVETVATHGGRLRHVYRNSVNGFAAQMSDGTARNLARDPRVALVEEDGFVSAVGCAVCTRRPGVSIASISGALPLDRRYSY